MTGDTLKYSIARDEGEDVSNEYALTITLGENPNYTITPVDGTFAIEQRPITITAADDEFEYDGKAHENNEVTVTGEIKLVEGHTLSANATGSVKNVKDTKSWRRNDTIINAINKNSFSQRFS